MLSNQRKRELCLQCMECCKILAVPVNVLASFSSEAVKFYGARGCWFGRLEGGIPAIIIPLPCPHLTPEGCNIYDKRPQVCKDYDGTKDPLMKSKCLWIKKNRRKK